METGSKKKVWAGRILGGFGVSFLLLDGVMKLVTPPPVLEAFDQLGYARGLAHGLGILLLACVAVHAHPRTSVLGAILLTGFLGGAVASHVRIGSPLFSHVLFPVYVGAMVWGGLFLRDDRLRALLPLRR